MSRTLFPRLAAVCVRVCKCVCVRLDTAWHSAATCGMRNVLCILPIQPVSRHKQRVCCVCVCCCVCAQIEIYINLNGQLSECFLERFRTSCGIAHLQPQLLLRRAIKIEPLAYCCVIQSKVSAIEMRNYQRNQAWKAVNRPSRALPVKSALR